VLGGAIVGIGGLLKEVVKKALNAFDNRLDRCARGEKLGINNERDSWCHQKWGALASLKEQFDGCRRKAEITQTPVLIYRRDVIFAVISICPSTARRRDESFGDQVPNLSLRYPGTGSKVSNVHAAPFDKRYGERILCVKLFLQLFCRKAGGTFRQAHWASRPAHVRGDRS
jgi:hypothetical protein